MKRLLLLALMTLVGQAADFRGSQFIGFSDFTQFKQEAQTLTSPVIEPAVNWDELVLSWNLRGEGEATIEARLIYPDHTTKFYNLGIWSKAKRQSVKDQNDTDAKVDTDTLIAKRPGA